METLNPDDVFYIILHCSATKVTSNCTPEQMRADHLKRGFEDIGYHYYIRKDGTVTQHRLLSEVGAHCKPWNRYSIGVCYEGGLDAEGTPSNTLTAAQWNKMTDLLSYLIKQFPRAHIRGHRDMPSSTPKDCPCFDARQLFGHLENPLYKDEE